MKYVEVELHSISISIWDFVTDNYERRINKQLRGV